MTKTSYELGGEIINAYSHLEEIEITTGINGYPQGLHRGIIGFANIDEAEQVAKEFGGDVVEFERRDGWQLWKSNGKMWEMYGLDRFKGDERRFCTSAEDVEDFYRERVADMLEAEMPMADIRRFLMPMDVLNDKIEDLEEGEYLMLNEYDPSDYEIVTDKVMSYAYDTHNYVIGVELHAQETEDEE